MLDAVFGLNRDDHAGRKALGVALFAAALSVSGPASAEEPKGCDAFKWSLKQEAVRLQAPGKPILDNGAAAKIDGGAFDLKLVAFDTAHLPMGPERQPKVQPSNAGFMTSDAPAFAGSYQITISQAAWIDVIQDGHGIKPSAFTGASDCPGVRKSIRVTLAKSPLTVQISGTQASSIGLLIAPAP